MTRITWIRHGEASEDVLGTHYGQSDVDLSDAGRQMPLPFGDGNLCLSNAGFNLSAALALSFCP